MRYIGIDYGAKKVGVAVSDPAGTMGFPRAILTNTPKLLDELGQLIRSEHIGAAVMGESKDFSGGDNAIAEDARAFAIALTAQSGIPVYFEPEAFTTALALRSRATDPASRAPKKYRAVDDSAAALILTSFLTKHHG